jgi:diguanylate cyclase (GGDEF)-like protein/PAS domain S-box-containing protein
MKTMSNAAQDMEPDSTVYKTLLESTKAIPWRIDWKSMQFTYIGPQIEQLLGWKPESWLTAQDWAARMHPEDREYVVNFCISQSKSGVDHEADYRALTSDGKYVWIRDVVHVVRDAQGEVSALVGFMFDISERKRNEEELLRMQREFEVLSFKDGLTGVPNRRMFDMIFEREWASARRNGQPLSLILLDVDFFKEYNDCYGHLAGDECLKRVARLLSVAAVRPRDLVARFGGEEFVLVLPETDAAPACQVAERCRNLVLGEMIPHVRSDVGPYLTVSQGVNTIVPGENDSATGFLEAVDKLLYRAKQQGRNSVFPAARSHDIGRAM